MAINVPKLSLEQLKKAVLIKYQILKLEKQLKAMLGSIASEGSKKAHISQATRKKISAAAKARWAKVKAAKSISSSPIKAEGTGPRNK